MRHGPSIRPLCKQRRNRVLGSKSLYRTPLLKIRLTSRISILRSATCRGPILIECGRCPSDPAFCLVRCLPARHGASRPSLGPLPIRLTPPNIAKLQKSLFKLCHEIVKTRYAQNDPDNARHADLIALFMFNFWNATGLLPMTQALVIFGSDLYPINGVITYESCH